MPPASRPETEPPSSALRARLPVLGRFVSLLTGRERARLGLAGLFALLTASAEVLAVGSVFPFLGAVSAPDALHDLPGIEWLRWLADPAEPGPFLVRLGALVLGLLVVANALRLATMWANYRFAWDVQRSLSERLLVAYTRVRYRDWSSHNLADAHTRVCSEVIHTTVSFIIPLLDLTMHVVGAGAIVLFLVLFNPLHALAIGALLGGAYLLLYLSVQRRLRAMGVERLDANLLRYRMAREALAGMRDHRITGTTDRFVGRFSHQSARFSAAEVQRMTWSIAPKYVLEVLAVGALLGLLVLTLVRGGDFATIAPVLGMYAFGAFRLMPRIQGAFYSLASMKVNRPTLEHIVDELHGHDAPSAFEPLAAPTPAAERTIELREVTVRWPGSARPALDRVTLSLGATEFLGVVGPSGAGKSTVAEVLLGLIEPDEGALVVDDRPLAAAERVGWRAHVGYVSQSVFLLDATIRENVAFGVPPEQVDEARLRRACSQARILDWIENEAPLGFDTMVGDDGARVSGGQRQRLGVARALYHESSLVVFDESTSALDNTTEQELVETIRGLRGERAIVVIAHRLSSVRDCDRVAVLRDGRVEAVGRWDDLVDSSATLREMLHATDDGRPALRGVATPSA